LTSSNTSSTGLSNQISTNVDPNVPILIGDGLLRKEVVHFVVDERRKVEMLSRLWVFPRASFW